MYIAISEPTAYRKKKVFIVICQTYLFIQFRQIGKSSVLDNRVESIKSENSFELSRLFYFVDKVGFISTIVQCYLMERIILTITIVYYLLKGVLPKGFFFFLPLYYTNILGLVQKLFSFRQSSASSS